MLRSKVGSWIRDEVTVVCSQIRSSRWIRGGRRVSWWRNSMGGSGMARCVGLTVLAPVKTATVVLHDVCGLRVLPGDRLAHVPTRIFSSMSFSLSIGREGGLSPLGARIRA